MNLGLVVHLRLVGLCIKGTGRALNTSRFATHDLCINEQTEALSGDDVWLKGLLTGVVGIAGMVDAAMA